MSGKRQEPARTGQPRTKPPRDTADDAMRTPPDDPDRDSSATREPIAPQPPGTKPERNTL